jgi:hypothetical protein
VVELVVFSLLFLAVSPNPAAGRAHFGGSALVMDKIAVFGWHPFAGSTIQIYVGFLAVLLNLLVTVLVTFVLRAFRVPEGTDGTLPTDRLPRRRERDRVRGGRARLARLLGGRSVGDEHEDERAVTIVS